MVTAPFITPFITPLAAPLVGKPHLVVDTPDQDVTVDGPIGSLTFTSRADGAYAYGYGNIDNLVLKPYADNVDARLMGDVELLQTYDNWFTNLTVGGDVENVHLEQFDYSDFVAYGNVDDVELFDSVDSAFALYGSVEDADVTWVRDSALTFGRVEDVLELDGVSESTVEVGIADDAIVEIEDSRDVQVSMVSADETEIELDEVVGLELSIDRGDVVIEGDDVSASAIQTGTGDDYLYLEEVTGTTIGTGSGHDDVVLEDADQIAVHTGEGDDFLSLTDQSSDAQVAYSLGDGRDSAYIDGGNTLGMLLDGDTDTLVFNTAAGGDHEVVTDGHDQLYLQTENGGLWGAQLVDFIDAGGQDGVAEWGNFSLTMQTPVVDDLFLG